MTNELIPSGLPPEVLEELREAKRSLEHRGLADRLTDLVGTPVTASIGMLPEAAEETLRNAIDKSLHTALNVALKTLGEQTDGGQPKLKTHKILAGLSGAAGGAFGFTTIAVELPVSTILILRSMADIAQSYGEDLSDVEARLACLEVFAFDAGKPEGSEDDTEVGYFAVRAGLSKHIADASKHLAKHGLSNTTAPPLVRLLSMISKRFGVVVSEKVAAQAIPVIGALGGALINSYFIDHYQDLARAHFAIRRLERKHGRDAIREAYNRLQ